MVTGAVLIDLIIDNIKERCTNKPASMVYTNVFEAAGEIEGSNLSVAVWGVVNLCLHY